MAATLRLTFDRLGRHHNPPGFDFPVDGELDDRFADELAAAVHRHARRYLASKGIEAHVDLDPETGAGEVRVYAGFHNAGTGTITRIDPEA